MPESACDLYSDNISILTDILLKKYNILSKKM